MKSAASNQLVAWIWP